MLQNLLVDRFGVRFHTETRELAQYELTFTDNGPRIAKAKPVPDGPLPKLPEDVEDPDRLKHLKTNVMNFGDGMRVKGDYTVTGIAVILPVSEASVGGSDRVSGVLRYRSNVGLESLFAATSSRNGSKRCFRW